MNNKFHNATGIKAMFYGDAPIFVFGDGTIFYNDKQFEPLALGAFDACFTPSNDALLILGDNASIWRVGFDGKENCLKEFGGFADFLAMNKKQKILALAMGRKVIVVEFPSLEVKFEFTPRMSPTCLAFDLSGNLMAIGHGKGIDLFELKLDSSAVEYVSPGGISNVSFSPDSKYLVAACAEPSLIGWQLTTGKAFRMAGYQAKPNSFAWTDDGLATSGGSVGVVWPFSGENGPMGQAGQTFGQRFAIVSAIAAARNILALGYHDGGVDICDMKTGSIKHIGGNFGVLGNGESPDLREAKNAILSLALNLNASKTAWIGLNGHYGLAKTA